MSGAMNKDEAKLRWSLMPFEQLKPIIDVLEFGCKKYDVDNWKKGMAHSRNFNSLMRHLTAWWGGEDTDEETGLSHLAHAGCRILFLLYNAKEHPEDDDRPRPAVQDDDFSDFTD
jgi:hypothetical protein